MNKQKKGFTLGKKIILLTLAMCAILCAASLFASYGAYREQMRGYLEQTGESLAGTLAGVVTPAELDYYYENQTMDDRYYEIQDYIFNLVANNSVEYLYVVRPHGIGVTFLFDSDMETGEDGDYYAGGYCSLGTYVDLEGMFAENLDRLLTGQEIEPIIEHDSSYGWLMTTCYPVKHLDGTMAGYIMTDISMNDVVAEQRSFLLNMGVVLALLTVGVMITYLVFIRRTVIKPVGQLNSAAKAYSGGENVGAFSNLKLSGNDELKTLADTFRMMLVELELHGQERTELAIFEERMEAEVKLATEINAAMLPKQLSKKTGLDFEIVGHVEQARDLSCKFYDYFYVNGNKLCVMVGEVPGSGMSAALFLVVAQTTVKSQMRSGRPIIEAMTDANRQIFEIGRGMGINILVGIIDENSEFTYINAGQAMPLIMRDQDRYEWLKSPVYAPLGQNENVVYKVETVSLKQGDRIFLHTSGLGDIVNDEGQRFSEQWLQTALNMSRSRQMDISTLLPYIASAGHAFSAAESSSENDFAVVGIECRRGSKALAYCRIPASRDGSAELIPFLKNQLTDNNFSQSDIARVIVLADEAFTLCCWQNKSGSPITVECAVGVDKIIELRFKGAFGGRNPLDEESIPSAVNAVGFIAANSLSCEFETGELHDILTVRKQTVDHILWERELRR